VGEEGVVEEWAGVGEAAGGQSICCGRTRAVAACLLAADSVVRTCPCSVTLGMTRTRWG
jgi:hypothetical protein